jgi:hypothetical protein
MDSLIGYIAQSHGIGRENLATELLAQILRSSKGTVLQEFFAHYGLVLSASADYQVQIQKRGKESRCIPDIQIQDEDENIRALVESKFQAGFTYHQPNSYVKEVRKGDLLLFVVPRSRQRLAFDRLLDLSRSVLGHGTVCSDSSGSTKALIDGRILEVTSWEDILNVLQQTVSKHYPVTIQQRVTSDIDQLRRFCEVADKETFAPLTANEIRGVGISTLLRHLTWITRELIARCIDKNIVQPKAESSKRTSKNRLRADFDSSLFFGQNLQLCAVDIWIGFWSWAWEDLPESPLWIEFSPRDQEANRILRQLREEKGESFVVKHQFSADYEEWLIPIPLKVGAPQDEVVDEALGFISDLKQFFERATRNGAGNALKDENSQPS